MNILPLNPLPAETSESAKGSRRIRNEGFVDEAVVFSVVMKGAYDRVYAMSEEMVLSSNEDDYAGWALPVSSPFRDLMDEQTPTGIRQPAVPVLQDNVVAVPSDAGIDEPYTGSHRWWLFGLSGIMTCAILTLTLLSLAQRGSNDVADGYLPVHKESPESMARPLTAKPPAIQRALTSVVSDK